MDINSLAPRAKSAVVSECGNYTYRRDNEVANDGDVIAFIGLHAIAKAESMTIKRYRHFARQFGARKFIAGNVFARHAQDSRAIAYYRFPVGADNIATLTGILRDADRVVLCLGDYTKLRKEMQQHVSDVLGLVAYSDKPTYCLGVTVTGCPVSVTVAPYDSFLLRWV